MAKSDQKKSAFSGLSELRGRLLFLLGAILVYRLGTHVPVPGVDPAALAQLFAQTRGSIVDIFNMFSGGALSRLSVFALGIMPYISASIIMQMLSTIVPTLEQMKKEGEAGRRKIAQYTRYGTLVLASFQAFGITVLLESQQVGGQSILLSTGVSFKITAVVTLVAGTMFLVWLGEQITQRGIGNGISLIIFAGIVAGLPNAIRGVLDLASTGVFSSVGVMLLLVGAILITYFVVFVERGQRRIVVNYAQRQQGRQMMNAQSSHLPLKINMAGVIPPIFASSLILFPATISTWLSNSDSMRWLGNISTLLAPGQPLYTLIYALLIIFFCFFYTALTFNPMDMADNLKKSGAFIPGVRPGVQTSKYIDTVVSRLTLVGAIYLTFVCLIPEFLIVKWNVPFYFGGTSLLIIVVVIMDLITQIQSHLMSRQYDSLMKKSSLSRGPGGAR